MLTVGCFVLALGQENWLQVKRTALFNSGRAAAQAAYFSSGTYATDFEASSHYLMLQLQESAGAGDSTGWVYWNKLLTSLHINQETPSTEDSWINAWVLASSKAAGQDLVPFYTAWKWPVSMATTAAVQALAFPSTDLSATTTCGSKCTGCCAAAPLASSGDGTEVYNTSNMVYTTILQQHNALRANHSAAALSWDASLAADAAMYAANCDFQHNYTLLGLLDQGENLYISNRGPAQSALNAAALSWYAELYNPGYNFTFQGDLPPNVKGVGHFTQ
jgi:hypothetical protein